jgi:hypothetical protein
MSEEQAEGREAVAVEQERKWSTSKFLIGIAKIISNLSTVAWSVYTYFVQVILREVFTATNGDLDAYLKSPVMIILVSGWVLITFVTACNLQHAFAAMVGNAKINAEFKAVAEFKGAGDAARVIEAVKK